MRKFVSLAVFTALVAPYAAPAFAQSADEIIVTATRRVDSAPGIFLEKKGDFLLLEVTVENDSREFGTRLKEIEQTIKNVIEAAKSQPNIELSVIDDNNFVRPL